MIERFAGEASAGPCGAVASILAQAFTAPEQRWSARSVAATLATPGTSGLLLHGAADGGGTIVPQACALLRVIAGEAEILTLAVLPAARRRRLGRRLVAACLDEAAAAGALRVHLEVGAGNAAARALYGATGFLATGRRPAYYRGGAGGEDAVLMARSLEAAPAAETA